MYTSIFLQILPAAVLIAIISIVLHGNIVLYVHKLFKYLCNRYCSHFTFFTILSIIIFFFCTFIIFSYSEKNVSSHSDAYTFSYTVKLNTFTKSMFLLTDLTKRRWLQYINRIGGIVELVHFALFFSETPNKYLPQEHLYRLLHPTSNCSWTIEE